MNLVKMLYVAWFILPMAMYITFAPALIFYKGRNSLDRKIFLKRLLVMSAVSLFLFYIVVPVPESVQKKYIQNVYNLVDNNSNVSLNHIKLAQTNYCELPYLSAFSFFMLQQAFVDDFEDVFKHQKSVSGSINNSRISETMQICKTNFI